MQLIIFIYYWLPIFKIDSFNYTVTSERRSFSSFSLFYIFLSQFFFYYLLSNSHAQRNIVSIIYIAYIIYFESFCYVMYYICIGGRFLEDCSYYYSQQIISAVANESLICFNLVKRALEPQSL